MTSNTSSSGCAKAMSFEALWHKPSVQKGTMRNRLPRDRTRYDRAIRARQIQHTWGGIVMRTISSLILGAICCLAFPDFLSAAVTGCPPAGYDTATLGAIRGRHFKIADAEERQTVR